jgi:DNA-damage-inducible protein D
MIDIMKGREAMNKSAKTKPVAQNPTVSTFEAIKQVDEAGNEFWSARELAKLLGYERWQNFTAVIQEAMEVCRAQGGSTEEVFIAVSKNPSKRGGRPSATYDYRLTRHACYILDDGAGRGE